MSEKMVPSEGRGFKVTTLFSFSVSLYLDGKASSTGEVQRQLHVSLPPMVVSTPLACQKSHQW